MVRSGVLQDDASFFVKLIGVPRALGQLKVPVRVIQTVVLYSEMTGQHQRGRFFLFFSFCGGRGGKDTHCAMK